MTELGRLLVDANDRWRETQPCSVDAQDLASGNDRLRRQQTLRTEARTTTAPSCNFQNMFSRIFSFLVAALLVGCSNIPVLPETSDLVASQEPRKLTLADPVSWKQVDKGQVQISFGILPGTFVAEKDNSLGTFYRGAAGSFFILSGPTSDMWGTFPAYIMRMEGGIWKSKKDGELRVYRYVEPNVWSRRMPVEGNGDPSKIMTFVANPGPQQGSDPTSTAIGIAQQNIVQKPGPIVPNAVGGALGVAIVSAMINVDQDKIELLTPTSLVSEQLGAKAKLDE